MQQRQTQPGESEAGRETSDRELLEAIHEQGRLTLDLVRSILSLLLPSEDRDRPSLEQLLVVIMAQQRDILAIGKTTHADLHRIARELPEAVAEAVNHGSSAQRRLS